MTEVMVSNKRIYVGNTPVNLLSGEVHYWRLMPEQWGAVLDAVKDIGLTVIASYIQWQFHEYEQGRYDFTGDTHPARNLKGFLELVRERGLWLIARPGPYTFTEWVNFGIPAYAVPYHRLHPKFLDAAKRYLDHILPVIRPYQATRGGNILLVEPDNQFETADVIYGDQLGLQGGDHLFQEFLEEKYRSIPALNESWGSHYTNFTHATATVGNVIQDPAYLRRYFDFLAFRSWYTRRYAKWLIGVFRDNDIDVPLYFNTYVDLQDQNPRELAQLVDIVGFDPYPTSEFRGTFDEHRSFLNATRYNAACSNVPYIAEFQSGIWHGKSYGSGVYTPNHYRLSALTAILGGAAGWNWYMIVNRDNWCFAPINEWGRKQLELTSVFGQIIRAFESANVPELKRVCQTSVTFAFEQHAGGTIRADDPVLESIYEAGVDHVFYDVETATCQAEILFYSGNQWLSRSGQEHLLDFVETGGHLVVFQDFPRQDENFLPCNVIGIQDPVSIIGAGYVGNFRTDIEVQLNGISGIVAQPPFICLYDDSTGRPITGRRLRSQSLNDTSAEEHEYLRSLILERELTIGYEEVRGQGTITVLGVPASPQLIVALHQHFNVPIAVLPLTPGVNAGLFTRDGHTYLIAVNNGAETKGARLQLNEALFPDGIYTLKELITGGKRRVSVGPEKTVTLDIGAKDGVLVEIACETRLDR